MVRRPGLGPTGRAERANEVPRPAESGPAAPPKPLAPLGPSPHRSSDAEADALRELETRLGDPELSLEGLPEPMLVRHLYLRMARPGAERAEGIETLAQGLLALEDPGRLRRCIDALFAQPRWVDVLPLELAARLTALEPGAVPRMKAEGWVANRSALESRMFETGETMELRLPLAAKVRGFAPAGSERPDYALCPGAPGRYELEIYDEGRFELLLMADLRGTECIDRLRVWVEDAPTGPR